LTDFPAKRRAHLINDHPDHLSLLIAFLEVRLISSSKEGFGGSVQQPEVRVTHDKLFLDLLVRFDQAQDLHWPRLLEESYYIKMLLRCLSHGGLILDHASELHVS
jgi:hypothetical protein